MISARATCCVKASCWLWKAPSNISVSLQLGSFVWDWWQGLRERSWEIIALGSNTAWESTTSGKGQGNVIHRPGKGMSLLVMQLSIPDPAGNVLPYMTWSFSFVAKSILGMASRWGQRLLSPLRTLEGEGCLTSLPVMMVFQSWIDKILPAASVS